MIGQNKYVQNYVIGNTNDAVTIADGAFRGCSNLSIIELEYSKVPPTPFEPEYSKVTSIGKNAFADCPKLERVTLSKTVTSIGEKLFEGSNTNASSSLTLCYNPENCESVADGAFNGVALLEIARSVKTIPEHAFKDCYSLCEIYFINRETSQLQTIGNEAFSGCSTLYTIGGFPSTLKTIGDSAFYGCSRLDELDLPASLTNIGDYAFCECTALNSVTIPLSLTSFTKSVFKNTQLTTVNYNAKNCNYTDVFSSPLGTKVSSVTIGSEVETIPARLFEDVLITTVTIPASVTSISTRSFARCSKLETVTFQENSKLKTIGYRAFAECNALKKIEIPSSVESIESMAFETCANLETVTISENSNLGRVNENAFEGCSALKTIYFPSKIRIINKSAYSGTALTEITIPAATSEIGDNAFSNISSKEVKLYYNANCDTVGKSVFAGTNVISVEVGEGVLSLPNLFQDCSTLKSVKLPSTLKSIADNTFSGCTQLGDVIFAENAILKTIGNGAFNNCSALNIFSIPSSVETIGNNAFQSCMSLETMVVNDNSRLKTIGDGAFNGCYLLRSFTVPSSVESVGDNAFQGCLDLARVNIGNDSKLKAIGNSAFEACVMLKNFNTPSTLQTIGSTAFSNTALTQITIPALTHKIGDNAFSNISSDEVKLYYNANCDTVGTSVFDQTNITSVEIGEGVTSLPDLFQYHLELKSVKISSTVKSIKNNAFLYCDGLSDVTFAEKFQVENHW